MDTITATSSGLQANPAIIRLLRSISVLMFIPALALAIPFAFTAPYFTRFIGIFPSLIAAASCVVAMNFRKQYTFAFFLSDLLIFWWFIIVLVVHMIGYSRENRRWCRTGQINFTVIAAYWTFPIIIQLVIHTYFMIAFGFKTAFDAFKETHWSHTVCPHCHKRPSGPSMTTRHQGSPIRYDLLQPDLEEYNDYDDDARRTSFGDEQPVAKTPPTTGASEV
jgi:hypothetical protein